MYDDLNSCINTRLGEHSILLPLPPTPPPLPSPLLVLLFQLIHDLVLELRLLYGEALERTLYLAQLILDIRVRRDSRRLEDGVLVRGDVGAKAGEKRAIPVVIAVSICSFGNQVSVLNEFTLKPFTLINHIIIIIGSTRFRTEIY